MIWHMGYKKHRVPALKLLNACHFSHLFRGSESFRDIVFFTWRDNIRQEEWKVAELYNSVNNIFDFDAMNNKMIKYKQCEQHIWKNIYGNIEEKQSSIGWRRTIRVNNFKELITL